MGGYFFRLCVSDLMGFFADFAAQWRFSDCGVKKEPVIEME